MQERLRNYFKDIVGKWNSLERSQKIRLISTVAILMGVLGLTLYIALRPKMVVLYDNLEYKTTSELETALKDAGIKAKPVKNGQAIEVPLKDANRAKISLASTDLMSKKGFTYQDALDYSGMGTTESVKIQNFKRVKETDLSDALSLFEGVDSAKVTLELPDPDNYVIESKQKASATAVLNLSENLSKSQSIAIARFLASSVKGLSLENIEILDQNINPIYSGQEQTQMSSGFGYDMELMRKSEIEAKIKAALVPLFNEVKITTNLVLKNDDVKTKTKTYSTEVPDSQSGLIAKESKEDQSVTNGNPDAEPGLGTNDNATTDYGMQGDTTSSANIKNSDREYLYDEQERVVDESIGEVVPDQSSISIFVYRYKNYDEKYLKAHDQVNAATTWEDFQDATRATPIDIANEYQAVVNALRVGTGITNLSVVGYEVPVFFDEVVEPIKIEQIVMFAILALLILLLAYGLFKRTQPDEITEIEPELSVEDLLVSTQLEEQKYGEELNLREIDFGKDSEVKRQIEKFVNEKPDAVAQLLRNWLNDDWE